MNILFRYILRETVGASLLGAALFTFVLFLRSVGPIMELLVRASVGGAEALRLFLLTIPQALPFTIPTGVLLGVLLALGRLSTDGELTGMRSAGLPTWRAALPVAAFSAAAAVLCAGVTLFFTPWAARELRETGERLKVSQVSAQVQPRIFIEDFPEKILYVRDVEAGDVVHWEGLFLADTRPPESRGSVRGLNAAVEGPRITIAEEAIVVPRPEQERLQIHLPRATTFEQSLDPLQYQVFDYEVGDQALEAPADRFEGGPQRFDLMPTAELWRATRTGDQRVQAAIVLHQRLALPVACLVLPLVGLPLAVSIQRAGKSVGVVAAVALAFLYYLLLLGGTALAEERRLPPQVAMWLANAVFAAIGVRMFSQLDSPGRRDWMALILGWLGLARDRIRARLAGLKSAEPDRPVDEVRSGPVPFIDWLLPVLDRYLLRRFLFYFALMTTTFVSIWCVFSFFELLADMLERQKMGLFAPYVYYLTPFLVYETAPLAVLAATLACFGLLAKHHELVAFRACGVSLYRLATPILVVALLVSGGLFLLDQRYLPEANRRQDAIRDEIKGRPVRTFLRPDRQWTYGEDERIFYHRFFDPERQELAGVNVYDFALEPFRLVRHIAAERARWDPEADTWIFEQGWVRKIDTLAARKTGRSAVTSFEQFDSREFPDIREEPSHFWRQERRHQQMNWRELGDYIADLTQSGFDTVRLRVLWHRKFSFPLVAFSMALLAIPFASLTGARGAIAPLAVSLGLAVAYYALRELFEELGNAGQLTPFLSAWAPAMIFGFSGAYLFLRTRT